MTDTAIMLRQEIDLARPVFDSVGNSQFEIEAGYAMQALTASDYIMKTALMNRQSVINAVRNIAAIGISLNPAKKQAYLVPRDGKICLDISYMGLLDLAIASGSIRWGQAELVREADTFVLNGVDQAPTHKRDPFDQNRGPVLGAYVVVKTPEGDYLTTAMVIKEIFAIRDRSSAAGQKGPWKTDEGEMIKKTVIKRAYKTWPKTDRLDQAIHHLNTEAGEGIEFSHVDDTISRDQHFGLSAPRAKQLRAAAAAAIEKFNVGDELAAYEEMEPFSRTNDELDATWFVLKNHSTLKTSLKATAAKIRLRDAELAQSQKPETVAAA